LQHRLFIFYKKRQIACTVSERSGNGSDKKGVAEMAGLDDVLGCGLPAVHKAVAVEKKGTARHEYAVREFRPAPFGIAAARPFHFFWEVLTAVPITAESAGSAAKDKHAGDG
jgi:hypothetical protein